MDLHEAWIHIKTMVDDLEHIQGVSDDEHKAMKVIDNHLDPYIKRICAMAGET